MAAAAVGVAQALIVLAWPHQVSSDRFSYPFTPTGHVIAQATFFLQHLPLLTATAVLAGSLRGRGPRAARIGLVIAAVGFAWLAVMEIVAMIAANSAEGSSLAMTVETLYAPSAILTGVGLTVAGVSLLRASRSRRDHDRALAWAVTGAGVWNFVGMMPLIISNNFVALRIGIIVWMLLLGAMGWRMRRS